MIHPDPTADAMREVLRAVKRWAEQKCPCENDEPNPCPLCGASVENLENCKAVDNTFPPRLREQIRAALFAARTDRDGTTLKGDILQIGGAGSGMGWGQNAIEVRESTGGVCWAWREITKDETAFILECLTRRSRLKSAPAPPEGQGK